MTISWAGVTGGSRSGTVSRAAANEVDTNVGIDAEEEFRRLDACFREVQEEDARHNRKDSKRVMARAIWRCFKADLKQCAYLKLGWSLFSVTAIAYFVRRWRDQLCTSEHCCSCNSSTRSTAPTH